MPSPSPLGGAAESQGFQPPVWWLCCLSLAAETEWGLLSCQGLSAFESPSTWWGLESLNSTRSVIGGEPLQALASECYQRRKWALPCDLEPHVSGFQALSVSWALRLCFLFACCDVLHRRLWDRPCPAWALVTLRGLSWALCMKSFGPQTPGVDGTRRVMGSVLM